MFRRITEKENKMELKQIVKSKTIGFNAIAPLVVAILPAFGVEATPEIVAGIFAILNIGLRLITKNAITDK